MYHITELNNDCQMGGHSSGVCLLYASEQIKNLCYFVAM